MLKKLTGFGLLSALMLMSISIYAEVSFVDVAGRQVTLEAPAEKVILGEGRFISILSVLGINDPVSFIAGMMNEFKLYDPDGYAAYQQAFPSIDEVQTFGHTSAESVSIEKILTLNPDVAIFGLSGHGPGARSKHIVDTLEAAGITVVFIDFRQDPIANTAKSVELVSIILGVPEKGEKFVQFYQQRLNLIASRVKGIPKSRFPKVLFELKANSEQECCLSVAKGMFADMARFAGGDSVASLLLPGPVGQLSYEYVLSSDFDIFIGTAIGSLKARKQTSKLLMSGAGVTSDLARRSLQSHVSARKFDDLRAIKNGAAYSLWHHFYNSAFNLYAIEKMATWFHPEIFDDLHPEATLNALLKGAEPVDLSGTYATSLTN